MLIRMFLNEINHFVAPKSKYFVVTLFACFKSSHLIRFQTQLRDYLQSATINVKKNRKLVFTKATGAECNTVHTSSCSLKKAGRIFASISLNLSALSRT